MLLIRRRKRLEPDLIRLAASRAEVSLLFLVSEILGVPIKTIVNEKKVVSLLNSGNALMYGKFLERRLHGIIKGYDALVLRAVREGESFILKTIMNGCGSSITICPPVSIAGFIGLRRTRVFEFRDAANHMFYLVYGHDKACPWFVTDTKPEAEIEKAVKQLKGFLLDIRQRVGIIQNSVIIPSEFKLYIFSGNVSRKNKTVKISPGVNYIEIHDIQRTIRYPMLMDKKGEVWYLYNEKRINNSLQYHLLSYNTLLSLRVS